MDSALGDYALKLASKFGADYADVRVEKTTGSGFLLKNGIPQISGSDVSHGIGMRVLINGTLGFGASNQLTKEGIKSMLSRTVRIAQNTTSLSKTTEFASEKAHQKKYVIKQKKNLLDIDPDEKLGMLLDIEKGLSSVKANIPGRFLSYGDGVREQCLFTTEGTRIEKTVPHVGIFYMVTIQKGAKTTQRYWQHGSAAGFEAAEKWDLANMLPEQCRVLNNNLGKGRILKKGSYDVVVGPEITGIMVHESMGHPYEADRILGRESAQAGGSFVTPKTLGTIVANPAVNVSDDPTLKGEAGFYLFDDEGVKASKTPIIEKGKVMNLLHSRESAVELGRKSNGFCRATSYDREPIVRMANTYFEPGSQSEEELIADIKEGVYVKNFNEWNIDDMRLNAKYVGAEAYLIHNGRIGNAVINPVIEVATPTLYKKIDAAANNLEHHTGTCGKGEPMQGIPVTLGGPSLRMRQLVMK